MASRSIDKVDIAAGAGAAGSMVDLALLLRRLRQRDAQTRDAAERTHHELATGLGCSAAQVGFYLGGVAVPPADRLDYLARSLGATPAEQRALAAARDRAAKAMSVSGPSAAPSLPVGPRALPPAPAGFVGRTAALAE